MVTKLSYEEKFNDLALLYKSIYTINVIYKNTIDSGIAEKLPTVLGDLEFIADHLSKELQIEKE